MGLLPDEKMNDKQLIEKLDKLGNFAVWRGGIKTRQSVEILALEANGITTEEVLSEAETLREAIANLP